MKLPARPVSPLTKIVFEWLGIRDSVVCSNEGDVVWFLKALGVITTPK